MITYSLKRSARARTMRLAIYPDGAVVLTAPRLVGIEAIERFFAQHIGWVEKKVADTRGKTIIRLRRGDIPALKRRARELAAERAAYYAKEYGVTYRAITIRAQKARWGSCSDKGNLSFNYKIAALPREMAEYIVVHEICHLKEMNHSKRFWAEVARTVPNYRDLRTGLRGVRFVFDRD